MASVRLNSHPQRKSVALRGLGIALASLAGISSMAVIGGCGNSASTSSTSSTGILSAIVLHGMYIEDQTGYNYALDFSSDGVSLYEGIKLDPSSGRYVGDCLSQNSNYELVGDTVRVSGGTLTPSGQAETMFTPQSGGNVTLFNLVNSGQELDLTRNDGSVLRFTKQ